MLYQEISKTDFIDRFHKMNRSENFSYEGLNALYGYFEELSEDQNIEFDVIAICCDFTEYDSLAEFNRDYGKNFSDIEEIFDHTQVIMIDNEKFIIQNFQSMEHLTYLGYDISIYPKNHEGYILAKAEHPYKDILIKKRFLYHTKRYIIRSIKNDIRYMEKIKDQ